MHGPALALGRVAADEPLHAAPAGLETVLRIFVRMRRLVPAHPATVLPRKVRAVVPVQAGLHVALPARRGGRGRQVGVPAAGPVVGGVGGFFVPFEEAESGRCALGDGQEGGDGSGIYGWGGGLGRVEARASSEAKGMMGNSIVVGRRWFGSGGVRGDEGLAVMISVLV